MAACMHWLPTFIHRCSCFWTNVGNYIQGTLGLGIPRSNKSASHVFPTKTKSLPSCHRNHHASTSTFGTSYYGSHEIFQSPLRYQASLLFQWVFTVNFCWVATIHPQGYAKIWTTKTHELPNTYSSFMGLVFWPIHLIYPSKLSMCR